MTDAPSLASQSVDAARLAVRALAARWLAGGLLDVNGPADEDLALRRVEARGDWEAARRAWLDRVRQSTATPLGRLAAALADDELELALLAAAADLDSEIARHYARLRGIGGVAPADVALLLDLARADRDERLALRARFGEDRPLRALSLIDLPGDGPLLGRIARASEPLVRALLGVAPEASPSRSLDELVLPDGCADEALAAFDALAALEPGPAPAALLVGGAEGAGRRTLLAALAAARGRAALRVELPADGAAASDTLRHAARDALLAGALLVVSSPAALPPSPALSAALAAAPAPILIAASSTAGPPAWAGPSLVVHLADPGQEARRALWTRALAGRVEAGEQEIALVADRYHLRPAAIARAVQRLEAAGSGSANAAALLAAARGELTHALGEVAERVETRGRWEDVVLPEEVVGRLKQIPVRLRHAGRVFEEWGFGTQANTPRGVAALFAGPPGTGKTLCAGIIASELGLELYRIDLSQVVSKWVGETEKNLSRVFEEASASRAIILFDEADSLFGRRTEVKSSSDRYANMEVNFLLQRIETYEGIAILTTNFQQSVDEAFRRRLAFRIEFPFPDEESRRELWRKLVSPRADLADDIDFEELARSFEFSGGNIRNAALAAAFASAEAGTPIGQDRLIEAARLEMEELGKLVAHP